jgi:hypothetical protein
MVDLQKCDFGRLKKCDLDHFDIVKYSEVLVEGKESE